MRVRARAAKDRVAAGATTEAQMLLVLADPAMQGKSAAAKAARAGVSPATWCRHLKDPLFRVRANAACAASLQEHLGPVLHALAESAKVVGRDGYQDRKLLLDLVGFTAEALAAHEAEGAQKPAAEMTDAELLACFEGQEHLLPPGLLRRMGKDPDAEFDKRAPAPVLPRPA